MQNILNRAVKYSIYVLVFLMPLFFLPFSFEAFEYNKQYLLFFLVSVIFFLWLAEQVIYEKEIRFRRTPLDIFVLAFLAVAILSAVFSVDKNSSLFGFYGRFSNGLIGFLSLGLFYFLLTNNIQSGENVSPKEKRSPKIGVDVILKIFLWSASLVILTSYLSVFGVLAKIEFLPQLMKQLTFNPVAGSLEGLAVFLAMVVLLLVGLSLNQNPKAKNSKFTPIFYWLLLLASLFLLLIFDFTVVWLVVLTTLLLFVGFSLWKRIFRENVNQLLIPMLLIVITAASIPFQPQLFDLPKEQILNQEISWGIGLKGAIANVKNGLLGSGIGTFHHLFAKDKPIEINQTWLWQIRFDRAGSHLAELLGTLGFLGIISYLAILAMFLLISWAFLQSKNWLLMPLLLMFLALVVGQFVYYQNTTLAFVFWLVLGLSACSWQKPVKEKVVSFKDFPELSLVFSTLVIILGVALLAVYFYGVKFYLADVNYTKALTMAQGAERTKNIEKAVALNPWLAQYRATLARIYLDEALVEMAKAPEERDSAKMQNGVARAIDQARMATSLGPNQVATWHALGMVYQEIRTVAAGATDWGIKSFEKAIELEPTNPVLYTELGKLYLGANEIDKAKEQFSQALVQKSDYIDALIQQAIVLEREDNLKGAISKTEDLAASYPFNPEVLFQLGRFYFNSNRITDAIAMFKKVILLSPNHSNAHYSLGIAYAAKGQDDLAIEEFEKVLELNPDNQDVINKLKQLR